MGTEYITIDEKDSRCIVVHEDNLITYEQRNKWIMIVLVVMFVLTCGVGAAYCIQYYGKHVEVISSVGDARAFSRTRNEENVAQTWTLPKIYGKKKSNGKTVKRSINFITKVFSNRRTPQISLSRSPVTS